MSTSLKNYLLLSNSFMITYMQKVFIKKIFTTFCEIFNFIFIDVF